jgi:hypothetical protein
MQSNLKIPQWAFMALSAVTAVIGLSASWITSKFFILGLVRLEPDDAARDILLAAGMLMIVTELACFGIASLLPAGKFRAERFKLLATGLVLLAFEAVTICVTQNALDQASASASTASVARLNELKSTIAARRESARSLRSNGAMQSESQNSWTRTLGAAALRDALKVETQIEPLAHELAQLEAAARPTTTSVLGQVGTNLYGVAKGLLISGMGLVMFGISGSFLRMAFSVNEAVEATKAETQKNASTVAAKPVKNTPVQISLLANQSPANATHTLGGYMHARWKEGCRKILRWSDNNHALNGQGNRPAHA